MKLDHYTLCFLVANPHAPRIDTVEEDAIQDRHMAHLADLHDEGVLVVAGPCIDERIRGVCVFTTDVTESLARLEADPAVRAGWFFVEAREWMVPEGGLVSSPTSLPRSMTDVT